MKTCPYCRKQIDAAATKCPHCQSVFGGEEIGQGKREQAGNIRANIVIAIAAMGALLWWLSQPGNVEWLGEKTFTPARNP